MYTNLIRRLSNRQKFTFLFIFMDAKAPHCHTLPDKASQIPSALFVAKLEIE